MRGDQPRVDEGQRELDIRVGLGMFASELQLERLLAIARQVDVPARETLFVQDAPVTTLFQVMSGELEMRAPDRPSWRIAGSGTVGLLDFMVGQRHARGAVTTGAARLLELDATDYRDYLEDNFEVSHRIMARLASTLIAEIVARPEASALLAAAAGPKQRSFAKIEIPMVERLMMMSRIPVFSGASMQGLADLAQGATEVRFAAGDVMTEAGSLSSVVSILVEGEVELVLPNGVRVPRSGRTLVAHVEELAVVPRLNAVVALTPVIALQLDREQLLDRFEEHFDLVMALMGFLARGQAKLNDLAAAAGDALATDWR